MSRIGSLNPVDVDTPHGSVRVSSRYRSDKKCYRLRLYGPVQAVQWMLPKRVVSAQSDGKARDEISHPDQPITTIAALEQFRRELISRWEDRLELGVDDPGLVVLQQQGQPTMATATVPTTLGSVVERYIAVHRAHLRPRSLVGYVKHLDRWLGLLGRHTPLVALSADSIRLGMATISAARSAATANAALRVLKIVLNYAVAEGYLNSLPHKRVGKLTAPPRIPVWWNQGDAARVLAAAQLDSADAHLVFALALYLGLRKGEIDRLSWEDLILDGDRPVCTVKSTEADPTKSGKTRHIPICTELRAILQVYRQVSGFVVRSGNGKGKWIYRFECDALFARVTKAAGVPKIRFHDMRHTYASLMLDAGLSMFKVSQWLGHSDVRITQNTYAHLAPYDAEVDLLSLARVPGQEGILGPDLGPGADQASPKAAPQPVVGSDS